MIVDSSALVTILLQEPGYEVLLRKLISTQLVAIGAPSLVESGIVLSAKLKEDARGFIARFLEEADVAIVPFTGAHYGVALGAWLKYGQGRHPANLSFGDCLTYAIAKLAGMPLLCVGDDFPRTDLSLA